MIDTSFLDALNRFSLVVNKRVTSSYTGERKSVFTGRGLTFKDHRIYVPGDDIRLIDWKVFARTDKLHVRQYEEERNLAVHIIIDSSASMDFGNRITKFDYAGMLGVGFAYLAMSSNEKFQFATFADDLEVFSPRKGMNQLAAMITHLNAKRPRGQSRLEWALKRYKKLINSKSYIVLLSDFLFDPKEIEQALYLLGNHEIKVIQVLDPTERNLAYEGDLKLIDSESNAMLRTFISPRLRSGYLDALEDHITKINGICNRLAIDFYSATTDKPPFDVFFNLLR